LHAVRYCSKSRTRVEGPWLKGITIRKPVSIVSQLKDWQQIEYDILCTEPNDRTVRWVWEPNGNVGKTAFVKYCLAKVPGTVVLSGKATDMYHILAKYHEKHDIQCVIVTLTRAVEQYVSYSALECIKDGLVVSGKYDSTVLNFNPPHVLVLANFGPDTTKLSADRWDIKQL